MFNKHMKCLTDILTHKGHTNENFTEIPLRLRLATIRKTNWQGRGEGKELFPLWNVN
jgi:hypothetical protein